MTGGKAPASTGAQVALFLWLKVGWGYESDGSESYAPQIMTHVRLHALSCRQGCFCESVNGFKTVMEIDTIVPGKACARSYSLFNISLHVFHFTCFCIRVCNLILYRWYICPSYGIASTEHTAATPRRIHCRVSPTVTGSEISAIGCCESFCPSTRPRISYN